MMTSLRVLIAEDNENDALLIVRQIRRAGYTVEFERVDTAADMTAALDHGGWDVIVSDVNMPSFSAEAALALITERGEDLPFIVVSGVIGEETAVTLLKSGAHDFVLKNNLARLVPAIERECREVGARRARREAEEARRVSEERYALAARGTNDGLWDWDLMTGGVYYSPRWVAITGNTADLKGRSEDWLGRIHPEDREAVERAIAEHLAGLSQHLQVEHRLRHRGGGWRWVVARGLAVRDASGRPCRMAGSLTDITARKLADQELRAAKEELENALAAKTRFLAAASHDLRQPFQSMRLYQHMLSEVVSDSLHKKIVGNLGEAMAAGEGLLHALLDISTLDAGVIPVHAADVRLLDVAAAVAREFEQEAASRRMDLRVRGSGDMVHTDATLLGRMLRNLLTNAFRYTRDGGRVLVACRRHGDGLRLQVWDSGIGIPEDMCSSVFEDFVQVGNAERDRRQGLGLGLSIVKRTAQLLGCTVSVQSRLGRGSVFSILFPHTAAVAPAGASAQAAAEAGRASPAAYRILVIEDDEMQLTALQMMLDSWGYSVVAASSAADAFARIVSGTPPPDLIVSDFRLPGEMNGVQAVSHLVELAGRPIPALIVTGDTAPERIREAAQTGCRLMHKPYNPAVLHATIDGIASRAAPGRRVAGSN
jgi:PAS domain S-box-containing protein